MDMPEFLGITTVVVITGATIYAGVRRLKRNTGDGERQKTGFDRFEEELKRIPIEHRAQMYRVLSSLRDGCYETRSRDAHMIGRRIEESIHSEYTRPLFLLDFLL